MHSIILFAFCLVTCVAGEPDNLKSTALNLEDLEVYPSMGLEEEWKYFKANYSKSYPNKAEEMRRKKIFARNLEEIVTHNQLYTNGRQTTFTMAVNLYSDLEISEVVKPMTDFKAENEAEIERSYEYADSDASKASPPNEIDWVSKGYVTAVKNQKNCYSCWAFAATGTLEGQHFRKTGKLVSLSEQQLVDCDTSNGACEPGFAYKALEYIAKNGGIDNEESYSYKGAKGQCRFKPYKVATTCKGYKKVSSSELALMKAVAEVGPIAVSIDSNHTSFNEYTNGVYNEPNCSNSKTTHTVLVVGYGSTSTGEDYWIVKNSWGIGWGCKGYIYMSRNKHNQCGISNHAVYPIV